jgi:hypothetical protein
MRSHEAKLVIIAGKKRKAKYVGIDLKDIIGKTVEAVTSNSVEGEFSNNISFNIFFKDGTKHSFVISENKED